MIVRFGLPALLICTLGACQNSPRTGVQIGMMGSSGAYETRFEDGREGYVIWCTDMGGCTRRAEALCAGAFTLNDLDTVDWSTTAPTSGVSYETRRKNAQPMIAATCPD